MLPGIIKKKSANYQAGVVLIIGLLIFGIYFEFTEQNKPDKY
jgi:hypothetical protein